MPTPLVHGAEPAEGVRALIGGRELRAQYRAYRRRQAQRLVRLMPREAVRPLYRRSVDLRLSRPGDSDPLAALVEYCETLLPLPSFELWCRDLEGHPEAHLEDLDDSAEAPTAEAPATVEARSFDYEGHTWIAYLRSFRDGVAWRGFIAFEDTRSSDVRRTTLIFREPDPVRLRERFLGFQGGALSAFLRSTLP